MAKAKKKVETQEEMEARNRASHIKDIKDAFKNVGQAPNERKIFTVGESVFVGHGGFISGYVTEIVDEGIYEVEITYETNKAYSSERHILIRRRVLGWYDVFKLANENCDIELGTDLRLNFMQQSVGSLISSYTINFGVDFNPSYQRDLVWDLENEQKLIESIFNRVDIGKFVFIHLGYASEIMYEILDGKQRLTALYRYYTDQFTYKGYYFSDLPWRLQCVFEETAVSVAVNQKDSLSEKDILNYFLKLNTSGKPMDVKHLENIEKRFNEL